MCVLDNPRLWICLAHIVWTAHDHINERDLDWHQPILNQLFLVVKETHFELEIVFCVVGVLYAMFEYKPRRA